LKGEGEGRIEGRGRSPVDGGNEGRKQQRDAKGKEREEEREKEGYTSVL
jgi:hypothetical protein